MWFKWNSQTIKGSQTQSLMRFEPGVEDHTIDVKVWLCMQISTVFAQLSIDGQAMGPHVFVVRLRDHQGHVQPGIHIKDNGPKAGLNGVDNGQIWYLPAAILVAGVLVRSTCISDACPHILAGPLRCNLKGQNAKTLGQPCLHISTSLSPELPRTTASHNKSRRIKPELQQNKCRISDQYKEFKPSHVGSIIARCQGKLCWTDMQVSVPKDSTAAPFLLSAPGLGRW